MKKHTLSAMTLLSLGGALFSMHFGASSMIWPMTWGKESGTSIIPAFLGVYLTAVFIPFLGYFALAKGEGTFLGLSRRISPMFAKIFCNITILVLGPLFVIPRMSAAAWGAFLQITGYEPFSMIPLLIFTSIYYALVYWFISGKDNTMDKISKILFPTLLITVAGVITKGLFTPLSIQGPKMYSEPAFVYGFLQGYATMELPCALLFGGFIINSLKSKNIGKDSISRYLIIVGLIGTSILALSHFFHMVIGSTTYGFFDDLKFSALYAAAVVQLWGTAGGIVFNIGLLFAALTCAVGITASTSEFYEEVSDKQIKYKNAAIIISILSGIVSILGLENIVILTEPMLTVIYPPAIMLTLCYALIPNIIYNERLMSGMRVAVSVSLVFGIIDGLIGYMNMFNLNISAFEKVYRLLPLSNYELGWILFSILGYFVGYFFIKKTSAIKMF